MREREARTRHSAVNFGRKENLEKAGSFFGGFRDYLQKVPRFFEGRERERSWRANVTSLASGWWWEGVQHVNCNGGVARPGSLR